MSANTDNNVKHHVQYDLSRGHPNDGLLPLSEMQAIMFSFLHDVTPNTLKIDDTPNKKNINNNHEATNSWIRSLNYGSNAGDERFLLALQSFLNRRSANDDVLGIITGQEDDYDLHRTTKSIKDEDKNKNHHLFITGGVSHGLELLCSTLTSPGEEVWVERPTYFLAPKIFESHGLVVKSLPMMSDRNVDGIIPGNEENMADSGVGSNPKGKFQLSGVGQIDIDRLIQMVEHDGIHAPKMIYIIPRYAILLVWKPVCHFYVSKRKVLTFFLYCYYPNKLSKSHREDHVSARTKEIGIICNAE